jgi:hypothetical protein
MIGMEVGDPPHPGGKPASIYVYVEDFDAAYQRALAVGATSTTPPENKPYQERAAGVKNSFSNIWYIATYTRIRGARPSRSNRSKPKPKPLPSRKENRLDSLVSSPQSSNRDEVPRLYSLYLFISAIGSSLPKKV